MKVFLLIAAGLAVVAVLGFVFLRPAPPAPEDAEADAALKDRLTRVQYYVTQQDGTEPPFANAYWDNKRPGLYVDLIDGTPLFASTTKYKSGTGWPSFWEPLSDDVITTHEDRSLLQVRTEVRSAASDSHLGHVFTDGPEPTGLRYCLNSAALRFVPADSLAAEGYGEYASLFDTPADA